MKQSDRGMGLIETLVGASLTLVAAATLLPLGILSTSITENHGHLSARTTEYAQDKMEQLLALAYGDATSDTTVFPANNTGGTGLTLLWQVSIPSANLKQITVSAVVAVKIGTIGNMPRSTVTTLKTFPF